ncbi:MAG: ATP synthase F0 subunit B [Desulfobacterales bacterium]|jgi:F-type H+-transporting ATPase subunit b
MHIVSNIALISINETLIIQLVSFLIFLFLINRIMFRPLSHVMVERENHLNEISAHIEKSETELAEINEQVRIQEMTAIDTANQEKKKLEEDGATQANDILEKSREEITAIRQESQQFIDRQIAKARQDIQTESEKLAVMIMEKVLDRRLANE